jgi:hypothetical protein
MNSSVFQQTVHNLWDSLELGPPDFDNEGVAKLQIDDLDLILMNSRDDQRLHIKCHAGFLPVNTPSERSQLEQILKMNLAFTASFEVWTVLEETEVGSSVVVNGTYSYVSNDLDSLANILTDVVSAAELYYGVLGNVGSISDQQQERHQVLQEKDDFLIFRP